jgi:two-component system LytT family response regulator
MHDVDWIESAANYVQLHSRSRSFMLRMTMGELEEKLDAQQFARIHRSTIVNVDRLVEVKPSLHGDFDVVLQDGTTLRMSRGYRDRVLPR